MTECIADRYPLIRKICLEIAYDNNFIRRGITEREWIERLDEVLGADGVYEQDLQYLENWLVALTEEEIQTLATGECYEAEALEVRAPRTREGDPLTNIFHDVFDNG